MRMTYYLPFVLFTIPNILIAAPAGPVDGSGGSGVVVSGVVVVVVVVVVPPTGGIHLQLHFQIWHPSGNVIKYG